MISKHLVSVQPSSGGLSFNMNDLIIPDVKEKLVEGAR
jgi:hypothetical protein